MHNKKIIFNWKMSGSIDFCDLFISKFPKFNPNYDFIICPSAPFFFKFSDKLLKNIFLGGQNCSRENNIENYSYTGEISINVLKEFCIKHCIIGHSERRKHFCETEDDILFKMQNLLEASLIPIVCVRKLFEDREFIKKIINIFSHCNFPELIIAYEPVSAIGTGIPEDLYNIEENINAIRSLIDLNKMKKEQRKIYITYGGSVSGENIKEILKICDGVLVGKASTSENKLDNLLENLL